MAVRQRGMRQKAFGLKADVDQHAVLRNRSDGAENLAAFFASAAVAGLLKLGKHLREVLDFAIPFGRGEFGLGGNGL